MVACPDAHAVSVQDLRDVVGMHAVEREREDAVVLLGRGCPHYMQMRDLRQGVKSQFAQFFFPLLNGVKANFLIVFDSCLQADSSGRVDSSSLKFVGQFRPARAIAGHIFDHLAAGQKRRHFFEQRLLAVQNADAHGRQHLVAGKGEEVHIQILHIHRNMGDALGSVADKDRARFMGQAGKSFDVITDAQNVGDLGHGYDLRPGRERRAESFFRDLAVDTALDELQNSAASGRQLLPGDEIAVMFHHTDQDLIAFFQDSSVAVCHQVQALRGVSGEDDLLRARGSDKTGRGLP